MGNPWIFRGALGSHAARKVMRRSKPPGNARAHKGEDGGGLRAHAREGMAMAKILAQIQRASTRSGCRHQQRPVRKNTVRLPCPPNTNCRGSSPSASGGYPERKIRTKTQAILYYVPAVDFRNRRFRSTLSLFLRGKRADAVLMRVVASTSCCGSKAMGHGRLVTAPDTR